MFLRQLLTSSRRSRRSLPARLGDRHRMLGIEWLESRRMLASTSFSGGKLTVLGNSSNETITVSSSAAGLIKVNGANVSVNGSSLKVAQTTSIFIDGRDGDDILKVTDANGPMPKAHLKGNAGNDTLTTSAAAGDKLDGGIGNDTLNSGAGIDEMFGKEGNDILIWNAGHGNDRIEGGVDLDTVQFKGSSAAEIFAVLANGVRVLVTRNVGNYAIDVNNVETINLSVLGGADTVTAGDLAGTDAAAVNVDLGVNAAGDLGADAVIVNGTAEADVIQATAAGSIVQVNGLFAQVNIVLAEAANDRLTVNGLGGGDTLTGGALAALMQLTLDGGDGNDIINGGNGADTLIGGDGGDTIDGNQGNDVAFMGAGNDTFVWDPGDGSDIVEGQDGQDTLRFNGSAGAETFAASSNGGRLLFTRNVGNIVMDTDNVETLNLNALGGTDIVTINDLAATDVAAVNVDLGVSGAGDAAADAVTVNGTVGVDVMSLSGSAGSVTITTTAVVVAITHAEPANDRLTINTSGGDDLVSASNLANTSLLLTINGGADDDILVGSQGNDTINGDAGNDLMFGEAGNDTFTGGSGTDTATGGAGADIDGGGIETFTQ